MALNPLYWAIQSTKRNDRWLLRAFARHLGTAEHPRGAVLSIYRKYRRRLEDALRAGRRTLEREIEALLDDARRELDVATVEVLRGAAERGMQSAREQTEYYRKDGLIFEPVGEVAEIATARNAWMLTYDQQAMAIRGLAANGQATVEAVVGDAGRLGIFQPAPMQAEGSRIIPESLTAGFVLYVAGKVAEALDTPFDKQAIAAVDDRTTETCLRANGQIQPFNGKFRLTGTPRFSNRKDWSPFHWYCRTSIVLYRPEYDDGLTEQLREDAAKERKRREEEEEGS